MTNIVFNRIKVAQFDELNDPFELFGVNLEDDYGAKALLRRKEVSEKWGVVCFSEDWLDPVLWSRYADKHRGIALGFEIDIHNAFGVKYHNERSATPELISYPLELALMLVKFHSWRYEREWRIFARLDHCERQGPLYFYPFNYVLKLRQVILGINCTMAVEKVREIVNKHHSNVVTIKARMADKHFSIVPDKDTVPVYPGPA